MAEPVELLSDELIDIFTATQAMRNSSRAIDFANLTLDDVRKQAIASIGGAEEGAQPGAGNSWDIDPPGKLTRLSRLKERVDRLFTNIDEREAAGRAAEKDRS